MLMPPSFTFFQRGGALRRSRDLLRQYLANEPAVRLLPHLLSLPLDLAPLPNPRAILHAPTSMVLHGGATDGRTLALLQTAAASIDSDVPTVYLALADDDATNLSPRAVIQGGLHRAGLPAHLLERRRPCVLLLDDLDRLPPNRRMLWIGFVQSLPTIWPEARALVALGDPGALPSLEALQLPRPTAEHLERWFCHLLPEHDPQELRAAIAAQPGMLRAGLCDLVLLALIYPLHGVPSSRAALYAQAYALVRPLLDGDEIAPAGPRIGREVLRHYRLARELAGGADFDLLAELPAAELAAVAPLAAGLLDDPRPVFDLLWQRRDTAAALRAYAASLLERPLPEYGLRLLGLLSEPSVPAPAALFDLIGPLLASFLAAAPSQACTWLPLLYERLTQPERLLLDLLVDPQQAEELRWLAADHMRQFNPPIIAVKPADETAAAIQAYLFALGAPEQRARLVEPALRSGMSALLRGRGGIARRQAVAEAILADPTAPAEVRALALAATPPDDPSDRSLLAQALHDRDPELRRAALSALHGGAPDHALAVLTAALEMEQADRRVLRDLIAAVATIAHPAAYGLLLRLIIDSQLAGDLRLWALKHLADHPAAATALLIRLVSARTLPALLRAAALRHLGQLGAAAAIPLVRQVLVSNEPTVLRIAAAEALGSLAEHAALRDAALAGLLLALEGPCLDAALTSAIARALGACGPAALPTLGELLAPSFRDDLRADWRAAAPQLETTAVLDWPNLNLPPALHTALLDMLAFGVTPADRPGGLDELAQRQAGLITLAAADGLCALVRRRPALRREAAVLLRRALDGAHPPEVTAYLIDRLGDLFGAAALFALLDDARLDRRLRWLALERLGARPENADRLLQHLIAGEHDMFTRIRLVELLGTLRERAALVVLRQLAEEPGTDQNLRVAALAACGMIDDPTAQASLLRVALDPQAPERVRAAAVAALPATLDPAGLRMLRDLLRVERVASDLAAALLHLLGRVRDRESLQLLMRYAQSDAPRTAVAAIGAITAIGDATVAPILVRISQNAQVSPGVRIEAIAALLQLCREEYLPLIRSWLVSPSMPLRLRAYAVLAEAFPDDPRLTVPLADMNEVLTLRIAALGHVQRLQPSDDLPARVLINPDEALQLRLEAAQFLIATAADDAGAYFGEVLEQTPLPVLQQRCIVGLVRAAAGDGPGALLAQRHLDQNTNASDVYAHWAATALTA